MAPRTTGLLTAERGELTLDQWRRLDVERYSHGPFLDRMWQLRDNVSAYERLPVGAKRCSGSGLLSSPAARGRIRRWRRPAPGRVQLQRVGPSHARITLPQPANRLVAS